MSISKKNLEHVAKLHAMLGSPNEGEANAARLKLLAFLAKHKMTWNDLTSLITGGSAQERQRQEDEARTATSSGAGIGDDANKFDALTLVHHLVGTYLDVKPHEAIAIALWILHSHVYTQSAVTPRLALTSPVRGCGKTTVLRLIDLLGRNPERLDGTSPAAIYWMIEQKHPTLLVDEADNLGLPGSGTLRAIMNSGHLAGGGVGRVIGGEYHKFSTFAPMAIAAIGSLPLPLMHRSVVVHMERTDKPLTRLPEGDKLGEDFQTINYVYSRVMVWAATAKLNASPDMPAELRNRQADNWRPLISIADDFDRLGETGWSDRAREAALMFARTYHDEDAGVVLLDDCRTIFNRERSDRIASHQLLTHLLDLDSNWSWSEWRGVLDDRQARKLTVGELARLLRPFGIRPRSLRVAGEKGGTRKGYFRKQFESSWARYCPDAGTPAQPDNVQYLRPAERSA